MRYLARVPDSEIERRERPAKRWRGCLRAAGVEGPSLDSVHCNLPHAA